MHIAIESATHRFPEEEQEIVARTLEANQYAIASELGIDSDVEVQDERTADEVEAF